MALDTNLVSYWKLDESSGNASDSVGSNTLTNNNTVTYSAGKINNGANFASASSQYLSVADNASLSITGDMSISMWVYIATQPSNVYYVLASKYLGTGNQRSFEFRYGDVSGTKKFEFRNSPDGTGASTTIGTLNYASLATTTYTHITMVYVASTGIVTIYANGTSIGTITSMATSIFDSTALFGLGGNNNGDSDYLNGSLDEVGIWSRALSAGEVSQLYSGGNGIQYPFTGVDNRIAFDAQSASDTGGVGASSLTYSHTCSGTNRILFVGFLFVDSNARTVSSITYNGVSMTPLYDLDPSGNRRVGMYYLINPATGTNNVVITASGAVSNEIMGASISYIGVKQTGFPDANNSANRGTTGNITTTVTTVADNAWLAGICWDNGGNPTAGTGTIKRTSSSGAFAGLDGFDSNSAKTPAGSTSLVTGITTNGYLFVASFAPNAGTNYPMTAVVGAFTLTGVSNILRIAMKLIATVQTYTLTGIATVLKRGYGIIATVQTYTLTGVDVTFRKAIKILGGTGAFTLTGVASLFSKGIHLVTTVGVFVLTGFSARFPIYWRNPDKNSATWDNNTKNVSTISNIQKTNINE